MLSEEIIQRILTKVMEPSREYTVADLTELLSQHYQFSEWDCGIIPSEDRERWKVLVKNSVRRSPMRTDFATNSWPELKVNRASPTRFFYHISDEQALQLVEVERPKDCDWWAAEMAVLANLEERGYLATYVGSKNLGYDILATDHDDSEIYVEVKSSTGLCSPEFIQNEWDMANQYGASYHLAILENYNPESSEDAEIQYIINPASMNVVEHTTTNYRLNRGTWNTP